MAPNIIGSVTGVQLSPDFTLAEAAGVGILKVVGEKALSRVKFIGNATIRSGLIKTGLAAGLYMAVKNKSGMLASVGKMECTALAVDAVEDFIAGAMARWGSKLGSMSTSGSIAASEANANYI